MRVNVLIYSGAFTDDWIRLECIFADLESCTPMAPERCLSAGVLMMHHILSPEMLICITALTNHAFVS